MSDAKASSVVPTFRTERSNSTSSTVSSGSFFGSRRGSQSQLFSGLQELKRKDDPTSVARRLSMSEQRPPAGMLGTMWNTYMRGHPGK